MKASNFDVLLLPGGFGVAKNLSTFGFKGQDMVVIPELEKVLKDFHKEKKIIGLACIAPIIAAKVFGTSSGGPGVKITLGMKGEHWPYNGSIDVAEKFGNTLKDTMVEGICEDKENKIYSTPAYMKVNVRPHEVYEGIDKMIKKISKSFKTKN